MYRTDHAHRWERTSYEPMSSSYARTLFDYSGALMTGETRPAEFGHTKDGDLVDVRRSGFAVDIDTHAMPLDVLAQKLEPGSVVRRIAPGSVITDAEAERLHEIEAARMAGAGMQEPSEPMPLAVSRQTPQHKWSRVADLVMAALAVGCVIGWALGRLA